MERGKIRRNGYAACGCISRPKDYLSLSFEMVAAAQESKRLGLCQKSLFVVPNHLTEQWASEYLQLYPSANILVATKKDFETKNMPVPGIDSSSFSIFSGRKGITVSGWKYCFRNVGYAMGNNAVSVRRSSFRGIRTMPSADGAPVRTGR